MTIWQEQTAKTHVRTDVTLLHNCDQNLKSDLPKKNFRFSLLTYDGIHYMHASIVPKDGKS